MAATQLRTITQPSYFRSGKNLSGSDIPKCRFVKGGATVDEIALATAVTDRILGVTQEVIFNTKTQSFQVDGRAIVEAGGAINIGDDVTTDASGRAVTATQAAGASQIVGGSARTAASQAGDFIEVELKQLGNIFSAILSVADRAAVKAIAASARFDGLVVLVKTDNSLWRFNSTAAQATDALTAGSEQFVIVPTSGSGRWHRADKSFVASFAIDFNTADAALLCTIPEGFTAKLPHFPHWEVTTGFTGGASSAIGVSTNKASYNTKGDLLGGASGDVTATLGTAGIKLGTIGPKIDTLAEWQALILVEGDALRFDRITSQYAAGAGFVRVPMIIESNDAPLTP